MQVKKSHPMKKLLKVLFWLAAVVIAVIIVFFGYVQLSWKKTYDAPYPALAATSDPATIARGKYPAYGAAHCAGCHVPMDKVMDIENGMELPFSGGWEESIPGLGTFRAPNLTPDPETGIGNMSDAELARAIRYSVKHDGTFLPPFMLFQGMSDEDLTAIISFLRTQEPVYNKVEPSEYTFLAKALLTFGMLKPQGPVSTPPVTVPMDTTAVYGQYIARDLGNCLGCHITRDEKGLQASPDFAGGGLFPPNAHSRGYAFISPNLTPHPTTGIMASWTERMFIDRFRGGRLHEGSPMPWGFYSRLEESDLKALYRYLHSLEPVENAVPQIVFAPGEELPH